MNQSTPTKANNDFTQVSLEQRKELSEKYMAESKGHFPFVIQRDPKSSLQIYEKPQIMLITGTLRIMNLFEVLRKKPQLNLNESKALFLFVNGSSILKTDSLIADCYYKYRREDGFVYITLSDISTWG